MNFLKKLIPNCIKDYYDNYLYNKFIKENKLNVLSDEDTINKIIREKKSIARFGDGEFKWMMNIKQESFQKSSEELSKKLSDILEKPNKNLLLCIPIAYNNLKGYTKSSSKFWKKFIRWYGKKTLVYLDKNYFYGNANFTRWYLEYSDKSNMPEKIKNLKRIWDKRDVVIIEGKNTKMGVGNDFFSNSKTISRIIAPATDAFEKYDKILNEAKKIEKDKLILIALGPTATILASDLCDFGYQAIDIGHIDIEYEWYLQNATHKIPIKGKFVNEAKGNDMNVSISDDFYEKSIIVEIGDK